MDKTNLKDMSISSLQDYLEKILMLSKEKDYVKSVDVAKKMNFSKASVSVALKKFKELGYIIIDEKGHIFLTEEGKKIANFIYDRHLTLTKLFTQLGIDDQVANDDACKIEHIISEDTYQALKKLVK